MTNEIQERIEVLLINLTEESEKYKSALSKNAGYNERKAIRTQIREIEDEIKYLKDKLKQLKP
ncbi:MAG: hypothetical protein JWM28_3600 [Chitinophagaceae bacterium]|nr:hypothetical protein [Chitinophagaceae bacterium]